MGLIPRRTGLCCASWLPGETRCSSERRLFKSRGCFLLIELDEVFDRKSIKRDGAARQLQSAEGSSAAALYIIVRTQYGKWKETHLLSATTGAINTTSGRCRHSALNQDPTPPPAFPPRSLGAKETVVQINAEGDYSPCERAAKITAAGPQNEYPEKTQMWNLLLWGFALIPVSTEVVLNLNPGRFLREVEAMV